MLIHCDVTRARKEECYDLPAGASVRMISCNEEGGMGQNSVQDLRFTEQVADHYYLFVSLILFYFFILI